MHALIGRTPGPTSGRWRSVGELRRAVAVAARAAVLTVERPVGTLMAVEWGTRLDLRTIAEARRLEDPDGEITDAWS